MWFTCKTCKIAYGIQKKNKHLFCPECNRLYIYTNFNKKERYALVRRIRRRGWRIAFATTEVK